MNICITHTHICNILYCRLFAEGSPEIFNIHGPLAGVCMFRQQPLLVLSSLEQLGHISHRIIIGQIHLYALLETMLGHFYFVSTVQCMYHCTVDTTCKLQILFSVSLFFIRAKPAVHFLQKSRLNIYVSSWML